jgi:hypothetical protein
MDNRTAPSIGATARTARQLSDGSWVTLELTASRTVFNLNPDDDVPEARDLGNQLHGAIDELFKGLDVKVGALPVRTSPKAQPAIAAQFQPAIAARQEGGPAQIMDCPEHPGQVMRIRIRENGTHFYSHMDDATGGSWCNYQPPST